SLDAEERIAFEAHLAAGCAECDKALREARWLVTRLAYLAPDSAPSQELKKRLMQEVGAEAGLVPFSAEKPKRAAVPVWLWAGGAAMLLVTLYSGWNAHRLGLEVAQMRQEISAEQQKREQLVQQVAVLEQDATMRAILTNPDSTHIMLLPSNRQMPSL